jgi:hypothetical protein
MPQTDTAADVFDRDAAIAWSWRLVWFGVAVRTLRYLCQFPLWNDEQYLALNLLERDFAGLLGGLDYDQAAPFGFLLVVKAFVESFGMNEFSLRACSLLSGIAGLIVFRSLAARLLTGTALVAAVGVMAVSFYPVRHSGELKPYAGDLLAATAIVFAALEWHRAPQRVLRAVAFAAASIAAICFSYPAVFVCGGCSLAMLPTVRQTRTRRLTIAYAVANLAILAAFAALHHFVLSRQFASATATGLMHDYWATAFPPSPAEPWKWPLWLLDAHTGEALAYPIGSKHGGSIISAALVMLGAIALWRHDRRWLPRAALATMALALSAACLELYPYGRGARIQQYWAPVLCLLWGAGAAAVAARFQTQLARRRAVGALVGLLVVLGVVWTLDGQLRGYKHRWDREHQLFSRWFWRFASDGAPQVCVASDLGRPIYPHLQQRSYLLHREIYRPADAAQVDSPASIPPGVPIECIAFALDSEQRDDAEFDHWMDAMLEQYRLVEERRYPVMLDAKPARSAKYYVWRFEPKSATARLDSIIRSPAMVADSRR